MQNATERRDTILRLLEVHGKMSRREIIEALPPEHRVTMKTIRRDIDYLSTKYYITSYKGRNGGIQLLNRYHRGPEYRWKPQVMDSLLHIKSLLSDPGDLDVMDRLIHLKLWNEWIDEYLFERL